MTLLSENERFQSGVQKYADYLKSVEGRLRTDLALANLRDFLPSHSLAALDVGGGTGAIAVLLARLGHHVTLLDSSLPMLDYAKRSIHEAGVSRNVELMHGEAAQLGELFEAGSFDLIVCHNSLEFVDDPADVLQNAARALRPSGAISVLVRNQPGEVLKAALINGDLAAAETNLTSEWGNESLYEGRVRLFTAGSLLAMMEQASFTVAAERGVRVVSDYLPQSISRNDEYQQIFQLERQLGMRPEFAAVARYRQCIAHKCSVTSV